MAVPIPQDQWGTVIVAFVEPRDGLTVTENQVKRHVAERLPRYMVPAHVEVVDDLPRTSNGKVDRVRLQQTASASSLGR